MPQPDSISDLPKIYTFGFLILLFFAIFRPLTVSFPNLGAISLLNLFGMISSYLMLIGVFFYFRRNLVTFIAVLLLFLAGYCLLSLVWGSSYRDVARAILPFIAFFFVQCIIKSERQIQILIIWLAFGYIIPIIGSAVLITTGASTFVITQSDVQRYDGLASGPHTLAHTMLIFSYIYALFLVQAKNTSLGMRGLMLGMLLLSFYCILEAYTRTVFLGGIVFWLIFLWGRNRKFFWGLLTVSLIVGVVYYANLQGFFWQYDASGRLNQNLDDAGSGRFELWSQNIAIYNKWSLPLKLIGVGIGNEMKVAPEIGTRIASSHNDYLMILMTTGFIGLSIILIIYAGLLVVVLRSTVDRQLKYLFLGMIIAVMLMNAVSNSYLTRFQLAQYFWLLMGLLFAIMRQSNLLKHEKTGREQI